MTLDRFLTDHRLQLSPTIKTLCNEGLVRMRETKDPGHDLAHIQRVFENLDDLLANEQSISVRAINIEVLLLAICWHDVWKASRVPGGIKVIIFDEYWEGLGSARLFRRATRKVGLSKELESATTYAIIAHASLYFGRPKTMEAVILRDVDRLDYWNLDRVRRLEEEYLEKRKIDRRLLKLAKLYFDFVLNRSTGQRFVTYPWAQKEYMTRKEKFLRRLDGLMQKYGYLLK